MGASQSPPAVTLSADWGAQEPRGGGREGPGGRGGREQGVKGTFGYILKLGPAGLADGSEVGYKEESPWGGHHGLTSETCVVGSTGASQETCLCPNSLEPVKVTLFGKKSLCRCNYGSRDEIILK